MIGAARPAALLLIAAIGLAACGGRRAAAPPKAVQPVRLEREWIDDTARFIDALDQSVQLTTSGGTDLRSAQLALHDESDLYAMLVAYIAFDQCEQTVLYDAAPNARLDGVATSLTAACRTLRRASDLFTVAVKQSDATVLLAATRTTLQAAPILYRAQAELEQIRASLG